MIPTHVDSYTHVHIHVCPVGPHIHGFYSHGFNQLMEIQKMENTPPKKLKCNTIKIKLILKIIQITTIYIACTLY